MEAAKRNLPARALRVLAGAALAAAICFGQVACATVNVDARGYRKYWEPYVSQRNPNAGTPSPAPEDPAEPPDGSSGQ